MKCFELLQINLAIIQFYCFLKQFSRSEFKMINKVKIVSEMLESSKKLTWNQFGSVPIFKNSDFTLDSLNITWPSSSSHGWRWHSILSPWDHFGTCRQSICVTQPPHTPQKPIKLSEIGTLQCNSNFQPQQILMAVLANVTIISSGMGIGRDANFIITE